MACSLAGCTNDATTDSSSSLPDSLGRCETEEMLTWIDVNPVFTSYCNDCHASDKEGASRQGASVGINYDTAEFARLNSTLTWQMIATDQMPLQETVLFEDAMLMWKWLSCGGPE